MVQTGKAPPRVGRLGEDAAVGRREVERVGLAAASVDRRVAETAVAKDRTTSKKRLHRNRYKWMLNGSRAGTTSCNVTQKKDTDDHTKDVQALLGELQGHVWEASTHKDGYEVVKLAMTHCRAKDWPLLVKEFHGKVWEAVEHPQANFVLQTIIEVTNRSSCRFIIDECLDKAVELAKHRHGHRIFCRIVEQCLGEDNAMFLIQRLLEDPKVVARLCCHNFGHQVMQLITEKGADEDRKIIVDVLSTDLIQMAQSRYASCIIEAAFEFCEEEDKKKLKNILVHERVIIDLSKHLFGGFVVKKLAGKEEEEDKDEPDEDGDDGGKDFKKETQKEIQKILRKNEAELRDHRHGQKVWEDVFPEKDGKHGPEEKDEDKGP